MMRRLTTWLATLSLSLFVLPFGACASSALKGVVESWQPCDVFNCEDPNYIDPCMYLQCDKIQRSPTYGEGEVQVIQSGSGSSSDTTQTTTTSGL